MMLCLMVEILGYNSVAVLCVFQAAKLAVEARRHKSFSLAAGMEGEG